MADTVTTLDSELSGLRAQPVAPAGRGAFNPALALLLACGATAMAAPPDLLTEVEAQSRAARVSKVEIDLAIEFSPRAQSYTGRAKVAFQLADTARDLRLDFHCPGLTDLSVNGTSIPTATSDGNRITLPARALSAGPNSVELAYSMPYERTGNGLHYFQDPADGREYLYTNFEPFTAHRFVPCFDQPDLKSVFALTVTVPSSWRVACNTREQLSEELAGGRIRHRFERTPRISTYLLFFGAGPYRVFLDARARIPSRVFARQSMARYVNAKEIFELTRQGLDFFEKYYGVDYPFGKYDQLFVPEFNPGAMENPAAVTFNENLLFRHDPSTRERQRRAEVILHEMAHMWFGDLVTMRWWDGLWLNESFATYMSAVAMTEATEFKDGFEEFLSSEKGWAYWQDQLPTTHPIDGKVADTDTAFSSFDGITYGKGASMLKQLAFFVGPDKFRDGVRRYFRKHAWGNTDLSDFMGAMGDAFGRSLTPWSQIHLETAGVNTVVPHLELEGGRIRSFALEQLEGNGDKKLRPQKLEVAFYSLGPDGGLRLDKVVPIAIHKARNPLPAAKGLPAPAFVWSNHGDHAYVRTFLDAASLEYVRKNLEKLPDGLTRRGVWMTLWEMVRDGKLAPAAYLDVFVEKAPLETDPKIQEGLFRAVSTALYHYTSGEARLAAIAKVHAMAWSNLSKAAAGSDGQKAWYGLTIDTATTPETLETIEGLLDGRIALPGLEMDPEKRWHVVRQLAGFDRPGAAARVASELKRDDTDLGRRQAARAEASLPSAANKEAVWKRTMEDKATSMDRLRAAMNGFHWWHQEALSKPFVERFFPAILKLRADRDQEFANTFVETLFPGNVKDPAVLGQVTAFLAANPELPSDLRKTLLNQADELERCLRILAAKP